MSNTPGAPEISGHQDPEGEPRWAMQLVVHMEKSDPPTRTAVCEAAATAVARFLADAEALPGGAWSPAVQRWTAGRITKHCRRARGSAWRRAEALPGVTAEVADARVRALVPTSVESIPRDVARLQLTGSEPADPDARTAVDPVPAGPVVVSICPDPVLTLGKAAAAAGHAAQLTALRMPADRLGVWAAAGFPVVVEQPDVGRWAALRAAAPVEIVDSGLTEVAGGTCTAIARWA